MTDINTTIQLTLNLIWTERERDRDVIAAAIKMALEQPEIHPYILWIQKFPVRPYPYRLWTVVDRSSVR